MLDWIGRICGGRGKALLSVVLIVLLSLANLFIKPAQLPSPPYSLEIKRVYTPPRAYSSSWVPRSTTLP